MGWTWYYPQQPLNRKKECLSLISNSYEVIKSFMVGSTFYGAIRHKNEYQIFCVIIETKISKGDFGYYQYDEFCNPNEAKCPDKILDLLTPTVSIPTNEWRELCRRNNLKAVELKEINKMPKGSKIIWETKFDLNSGIKAGTKMVLDRRDNGKRLYWGHKNYKYPNSLVEKGNFELLHEVDSIKINGKEVKVGKKYICSLFDIPSKKEYRIEKIYDNGSVKDNVLYPLIVGSILIDEKNEVKKEFALCDYLDGELIFNETNEEAKE